MFHPNNLPSLLALFFIVHTVGFAKDHYLGYAREEPLFATQNFPKGITEFDLKGLPIDDPKLRIAYVWLIRSAHNSPKIINDDNLEMVATLNDLRRRGDAATPLMLDIMDKNHNTNLESLIPFIINKVKTIQMTPYVDYFRQMIKIRPNEIHAAANEIIAKIFLEHGTPEDMELLKELAKKRPFLASSLERAYAFERRKKPRIAANQTGASSIMPEPSQAAPRPATGAVSTAPLAGAAPVLATPWSAAVVLTGAALTGLLWWRLRKGRM